MIGVVELKSKSIVRGDIYYVRGYLDAVGSEQKANGRSRPAIVISNNIGNKYSKIKQVVYITTKNKNEIPTHVLINSAKYTSIAICEQIFSISDERIGRYVGHCTEDEIKELDKALMISIGLDENYK